PEEKDPENDEDNTWYVMHTTREGQLVTQRLTTEQVQRVIREPHFDIKAQASHTLNGNYRLLASYSQFAPALRGLLNKAKVDRKSVKMRTAFQDIIDAEEKRKRGRSWQRLYD